MIINITVLFLSFLQNIANSMISRARNRDNITYHAISSLFSNLLWFTTIGILVANELSWSIAPYYIGGAVTGSIAGSYTSMYVEKLFNAKT